MLRKSTKAAIAIALAAALTGSSSVAFANDDYDHLMGRKLIQGEDKVARATSLGSGLACAAGAAWSGVFTWGIGPALAGLACAAIASTATRTAMRCSVEKEARIRAGLGEKCFEISVPFINVKF